MNLKLLELLACPSCKSSLRYPGAIPPTRIVTDGTLLCDRCGKSYPIVNGIPRFVPATSYANSFGMQWNRFRTEQIDSLNRTSQSARRLATETGWSPEWLAGKWVLDAGCGAGRFLEVMSRNNCDVVGVDLSNAVDAAQATLGGRANVHLVQASIFELPFRDGVFDACYCIGVLQHTPDPKAALGALPRVLKAGGRLAVTIYERRRFTMLNGKYLVRPITRRLPPKLLNGLVTAIMPIAFPITELLFRLPGLGRVFRFAIPIYNYVDIDELSIEQRYRWAILDTVDGLTPRFDAPQRESDTRRILTETGMVDITRLPNAGLNLVARKAS